MKMKLLAIAALLGATQVAFGKVICTITDENRIPVWAHKVTRDENPNMQGMYVQVLGATKVLKNAAGKSVGEIENYGTRLTYERPGKLATFCSLKDDELQSPENRAILNFAIKNKHNSSNSTAIAAAIKARDGIAAMNSFNAYIEEFSRKAHGVINTAATTVSGKLQPLSTKIDAQISRATNSAAAQKLQSGLESATRRVDTVATDFSHSANNMIDRSFNK